MLAHINVTMHTEGAVAPIDDDHLWFGGHSLTEPATIDQAGAFPTHFTEVQVVGALTDQTKAFLLEDRLDGGFHGGAGAVINRGLNKRSFSST